jgi:hypothetical protein
MIKINHLARISYLRKHASFSRRGKLAQVSGFALLLKEEPCPLCLQMVFLSNLSWPLSFVFIAAMKF